MGGGCEMQWVQMQGMVLNGLVSQGIARSAAKARGLKVSDAEVDKAIADFKKQIAGGNKMTDQEFEERLQLNGLTVDDLRNQERENLLPKVLGDSLTKGIAAPKPRKMTEADLIKSYNEIKLRHILVDTKKLPEDQAKRKADALYAEAK